MIGDYFVVFDGVEVTIEIRDGGACGAYEVAVVAPPSRRDLASCDVLSSPVLVGAFMQWLRKNDVDADAGAGALV